MNIALDGRHDDLAGTLGLLLILLHKRLKVSY